MSILIAVVFDDIDEASQVRETIRKEQHSDLISLDDSAIVVKGEDGKIHIQNEVDRGVKVGAVGGSLLGLLLAKPWGRILQRSFSSSGVATRLLPSPACAPTKAPSCKPPWAQRKKKPCVRN